MRQLAYAFSTIAMMAVPAAAQDVPPVTTHDLGDGIYALTNDRAGNVGILVGPDGVFMIDTQMAQFAPSLEDAILAVSGGDDVDLILNTHLHGDHVLGNQYFAEQGAVVMAHPNVRPGLIEPNLMMISGNTPDPLSGLALPTVNVDEGDAVTMNGQTARFYHAPNAHTDGDLFVLFEEANVIHAGDLLFHLRFPFIDLDNGGSVQGYIRGMEKIIDTANDETVIISGHGSMANVEDIQASVDMLTDAQGRIMALVSEGMTLEEIQAAEPLADYHEDWNWGFITTERMVWTIYRDSTGLTE